MNQKIWNCYLIASMNAMRLNPYFMEELYKNISFSKNDNIFETKVSYVFPDWEKVIVSIKDLKNQKEESEKNKFDFKELDNLVEKVLKSIVKDWNVEKLINREQCKYDFDSRNKKRLIFSRDFIHEVKEQIISCDWGYYNILEKQEEYKSVDAPIWYKILEALYTKKVSKTWDRKLMIWWKPKDVLQSFLSMDKWEFIDFNYGNRKFIIDIFEDIKSKKYIITTSIFNRLNDLRMTPYFSYNDYKMADWHAYSIVWFDKEKEEIEIVNPWDNNKSMFFSIEKFYKLFSNITIAKRK